jgi:hypothetical protein
MIHEIIFETSFFRLSYVCRFIILELTALNDPASNLKEPQRHRICVVGQTELCISGVRLSRRLHDYDLC